MTTGRADQLTYFGETEITLYGIEYSMKFDIGVIQQFESRSGKDFPSLALASISAWIELQQARVGEGGDEVTHLRIGRELTKVISREDCAHLFYLGAHQVNSQVSFEEIQEGIMLDGPYRRKITDEDHPQDGELTESYPILFVNVMLALQRDAYNNIKKKSEATTTT